MIVRVRMVGGVLAGYLVLFLGTPAAESLSAPVPSVPGTSDRPDASAPIRTKVTCARYRERVAASAPHAAFDTRLRKQSWGQYPRHCASFRAVLSCGADSRGQVVVASPLFGKDLEAHYAPLFAKLDIDRLDCTVGNARTVCRTKHQRDVGVLVTDAALQAFVISIMKRSPTAPRSSAR
jgi:hypothetical protein